LLCSALGLALVQQGIAARLCFFLFLSWERRRNELPSLLSFRSVSGSVLVGLGPFCSLWAEFGLPVASFG
jgi:hypothetical protein